MKNKKDLLALVGLLILITLFSFFYLYLKPALSQTTQKYTVFKTENEGFKFVNLSGNYLPIFAQTPTQNSPGNQVATKEYVDLVCSGLPSSHTLSCWAKTYGGGSYDSSASISQTQDGGYILAGWTYSFSAGVPDALVIKLNSSGNIQWAKTYGGSGEDYASSISQTQDGGYILAGNTHSFGPVVSGALVIKLDSSGNIQWAKTYWENSYSDYRVYSISQTQDGGYILAGDTYSFGARESDALVIKLDSSGNIQWAKTYGGSNYDYASSISQTQDGGYILAGNTLSFGAGENDALVIKLNSSGNIQWAKTYGGGWGDGASSISQTQDGGYILAGWTYSFSVGQSDALVIKLDSSGNIQWAKTYGGSNYDYASSISQTQDGGYILAGDTHSFGAGGYDALVIKLNSSGNIQWAKTYGGGWGDGASSISQTQDGGYILAGATYSFSVGENDVLVIKLDSSGNIAFTAGPIMQNVNPVESSPSLSTFNVKNSIQTKSISLSSSNISSSLSVLAPNLIVNSFGNSCK